MPIDCRMEIRMGNKSTDEGHRCIVCLVDGTPCFSDDAKLPYPVKVRKKDAGSKAYHMPKPFELYVEKESGIYGRAGDWLIIGHKGAKIVTSELFAEEFEVME
jgi:hypothetical protein